MKSCLSFVFRIPSNCRFLAIDWGALAGGMVTPELARKFEAEGVVLIPPSVGADFFTHEILHGSPQTRDYSWR